VSSLGEDLFDRSMRPESNILRRSRKTVGTAMTWRCLDFGLEQRAVDRDVRMFGLSTPSAFSAWTTSGQFWQ
jgi:hypothetical protein